jgi:hypothetical protein
MKERPILFSAPMVRAILEGRKTQTRRIISPQNCRFGSAPAAYWQHGNFAQAWKDGSGGLEYLHVPCHVDDEGACERCDEWGWPTTAHRLWPAWWPHGSYWGEENERPPHRLWVRETWARNENQLSDDQMDTSIVYRADGETRATDNGCDKPWRPSIFMPRSASRIALEITEVRVQRLQDISEGDAKAEGVEALDVERYEHDFAICPQCGGTRLYTAFSGNGGALPDTDCERCDAHVKRYQHLWESINGKESWDANPWVWAITFPKFEAAA